MIIKLVNNALLLLLSASLLFSCSKPIDQLVLPTSSSATLTGKVLNTGAHTESAIVSLYSTSASLTAQSVTDSSLKPYLSGKQTTSENGDFAFHHLEPGLYSIIVQDVSGHSATLSNIQVNTGITQLSDIELSSQASVQFKVQLSQSSDYAECIVALSQGGRETTQKVDPSGAVSFQSFSTGAHSLSISHPLYTPYSLSDFVISGSQSLDLGTIKLNRKSPAPPTQSTPISPTLPSTPSPSDPLLSSPTSGYCSGFVKDSTTGQFLSGISVILYTQGQQSVFKTNSQGYFEFSDCPVGQGTLQVMHDQYQSSITSITIPTSGAVPVTLSLLAKSTSISPTPIPDTNTDIDTVTVTGLVLSQTLKTPLALTIISIPELDVQVQTDSDGQFTLKDVPVGQYDCSLSHASHIVKQDRITLSASQPVIPLFYLQPKTGSLSGTISSGDLPLPQATLSLKDHLDQTIATAVSSSDGHYTFSSISPGDYTLHASKRHYKHSPVPVTILAGETQLSFNTSLTSVTYDRSFSIQGQYSFSSIGTSLTQGHVTLSGPQSNPKQLRSAIQQDGSASFQNLLPGTYIVTVTHDGFETHTETIIIDNQMSSPHTIILAPKYGSLTVHVSFLGKYNLKNRPITITSNLTGFSQTHTTNEQGLLTVDNLPYGTYTVVSHADHYYQQYTTTLVISQSSTYIQVGLESGRH